jgi:hypothetical protein
MMTWKKIFDLPKIVPVNVPDGMSGPWEIYSYSVSEQDEKFGFLRAMVSGSRRFVPAGSYKGLKRNNNIIMSNTPDEVRDCFGFFREAKGKVLINGLGLGIALKAILNKVDDNGNPMVTKVTVIEKSEDVTKLVAPSFENDKRVTIINDDALTYKPSGNFDVAWHDIWDDVCADNLKEMHKLHRKYGRKTQWQGSWCRETCEYLRREEI